MKKALSELERLEAGGNAWEASTPTSERVEARKPLDRILQVRLTEPQWRELRTRAALLGIAPSALLRMWTIEKLREPSTAAPR